MREAEERFEIFTAFRSGMGKFFSLSDLPSHMKHRHSTISHRIADSMRPFFPEEMEIDVDADGADVLVWNSGGYALALFWSSSYLSADGRRKAIAFHEKHSPALTLAFSLFPEREQMLVYRIEKGFIEYLHIEKDTFEEKVLRRCTIDEGKKDGGQLLLPIRRKRGRKIT